MNNSLSWNNSTVITASVCATVNIIDNCTVWTSPRSQWTNLTVLPLLLCTVVAVLNLYNLAVFRLWPQKEPYLLFHIFLAANAVVAAALSYLSPISRILDWTHPNRWTYKVGMGGLVLIQFTAMVNVAFMGIDRWLSVEFAVQYRNYSSRSRILWVIGLMYLFSILHTAIPMIIYRDCFLLFCSRQPAFRWSGRSYVIWNLTRGPLFLLIIILTQGRICAIATGAKLRLLRNRRVRAHEAAIPTTVSSVDRKKMRENIRQARRMVRTIWESVLPGSAVVMGALISNLPYYLVEILGVGESGSPAVMFTVFVFATQHMQTPIIYLLFFRPYRKAAKRLCGCEGGLGGDGNGTVRRPSEGTQRCRSAIQDSYSGTTGHRSANAEAAL